MEKEKLIKKVLGQTAHIVSPLVGGMMNQSFIVTANDKKYVLYISTKQANEMVNRQLEKDNQQLVIDLGITSKNYYFDTKKGIKINEYIDGLSLDKVDSYDINQVAKLLQTLHHSNKLSQEDYAPFKRFAAYEEEAEQFQSTKDELYSLLANTLYQNKDFLEEQRKVLCHNDAQKSNIVKSLDDKYYLIDFEFMGNNDPIYDIATFGNGSVEEGFELLNIYFNNHPTLQEKQRYYLWRIFVSLQWHNVAIIKHYRGEGKTHGFNFLDVANFFLRNAETSYKYLVTLK